MKKLIIKFILFVSLFDFELGISQNLIPNYSFEIYTDCPELNGEYLISLTPPWKGITNNSVDYFNACSSSRGIPYQTNGNGYFQYANTGNGMAAAFLINGFGANYREYLQVALTESLNLGSCYFVSYYVNLANDSHYSTSNIDAYFCTNEILNNGTDQPIYVNPQIKNKKIINDTLNWYHIKGIYEAEGNENFIVIGNFNNDNEMQYLVNDFGLYPGAIYYFDDISVIPIDSLPNSMPANAGEDVLVNPGDSIFIGQEISNLNCTWRTLDGTVVATNTSGIYVQPTETTSYVVEQNLCGVVTYDTVEVSVGYVGFENLSPHSELHIYPNPTKGSFEIDFGQLKGKCQVSVLDATGRIIHSLDSHLDCAQCSKFNLQVSKGVYFISIQSEKGRWSEKLVIE